MIIGAALAFVQDDIKKVLAYSTISQLGYMVMALGVGAWVAAVFHLFTHAFFKANLFLGAGSVSHSGSHHSFDMKKDMGGLRKYMPQTFWTFIIGTIALAGIFPLAGFWSKDEILVNANENDYVLFLIVGLDRRVHDRGVHDALRVPHVLRRVPRRPPRRSRTTPRRRATSWSSTTSPRSQTLAARRARTTASRTRATGSSPVPLWILSFFSVFVGLLNAPGIEKFTEWFEPRFAFPELAARRVLVGLAAHLGDRGAARRRRVVRCTTGGTSGRSASPSATAAAYAGKQFLVNKYYLDCALHRRHRRLRSRARSRAAYWFNQHVIDNVLNYTGRGARSLGQGHVRLHRPEGCRRRRQRHRHQHRRSRWRGPPDPDRSPAVLRIHAGPRGGRVRPRCCGSWLSGGNQLDGMVGMGTEPRGLRARGRRSHRDAHPACEEELIKWVTLLTTLATFGVVIGIVADFDYDRATRSAVPDRQQVDRRSSTAATTSASTASRCRCSPCRRSSRVLCVIYSWNHFPEPHNPKAFLALMLILEVGMNGTFVAQDLILFFIFFEIVLLPMFFMIGVWGGPNREYASIKFFLFTLFGSAMMLLSFLALYFQVDVAPDVAGAQHSFDMVLLSNAAGAGITHGVQLLIFGGPVPRVRDQGADVPVPHVAPRRAHRGADRRLGAAGRDPAEARHLRLHPHRAADAARGGEELGARGSGCSPSSASSTARSGASRRPT